MAHTQGGAGKSQVSTVQKGWQSLPSLTLCEDVDSVTHLWPEVGCLTETVPSEVRGMCLYIQLYTIKAVSLT